MDNLIVFNQEVTTYNFYSEVLQQFLKVYKNNCENKPIIDMRKTEYLSPAVVPVILSFGDYLRRMYKQSIELWVNDDSELLNFLICSNFDKIASGLCIFEIKRNVYELWNYKPLRSLHKISYTNTHYKDADEISNFNHKKNYIFDCLVDRNKAMYCEILKDTNRLPDNVIEATINSISEIETNAIVYSGAYSFTYVASNRYGTNISIADSGIGFENAFQNAGRELIMLNKFKNLNPRFKNFLIIMSALNYSYVKHLNDIREDLWKLKTNIVNNHGTFKIQYENTQVIFTSNKCYRCQKIEGKEDISECVECLLRKSSFDLYSPVKLFDIGFQGVRIEISVKREE